jgi:hypothetical protein
MTDDPFWVRLVSDPRLLDVAGRHGVRNFGVEFGGGTPGDKAELRELQKPLGLATIGAAGNRNGPLIVIADTGNHRVVVWDRRTRYVTWWQPEGADSGFRPVAVAADPLDPNADYVLDRRTDRAVSAPICWPQALAGDGLPGIGGRRRCERYHVA